MLLQSVLSRTGQIKKYTQYWKMRDCLYWKSMDCIFRLNIACVLASFQITQAKILCLVLKCIFTLIFFLPLFRKVNFSKLFNEFKPRLPQQYYVEKLMQIGSFLSSVKVCSDVLKISFFCYKVCSFLRHCGLLWHCGILWHSVVFCKLWHSVAFCETVAFFKLWHSVTLWHFVKLWHCGILRHCSIMWHCGIL